LEALKINAAGNSKAFLVRVHGVKSQKTVR